MTDSNLEVAIIGGGIAGLAAAMVLREAHNVTVYERNAAQTPEAGAAIGLGPNGSKIAQSLGLTREKLKAVVCSGFRSFDQKGNLVRESRMECAKLFGSDWWMLHRQDLKEALLEAATNPGAPGNPAKIVYDTQVDRVDADLAFVQLADGSLIKADLIIGADGIHSRVRTAVVGEGHPQPSPANLSLYRFTLPTEDISKTMGSIPAALSDESGVFLTSVIAGDESNRNAIIYPCCNREVMNFALAVPDSMLKQETEESWTKGADNLEMLEHFKDFPSWLHTLLRNTLDLDVKLYQLRDADPLSTFVKGNVVLIGDAAHPMVPYQGQGANQALEDAEGFRLLLKDDFTKERLSDILQTWNSLRCPRASQVQLNSRIAAAKVTPDVMMQRMRFNWTYSGIKEAIAGH